MTILRSIIILMAGAALAAKKNLIIDTDLFSDVDDAGALLLGATLPNVNLLAVNVNYPSTYSAIAASAILSYYGHSDVPVGIKRPLNNDTFFDSHNYELGEYASKVAYHWSGGSVTWGHAEDAWDPATLYRKALAEAEDGSVTIASIGFLDNLSALLNSAADTYSNLNGRDLVKAKVSELVIMGGGYPSGHSWNFWGSDPSLTAHVINSWEGRMVFMGDDIGKNVKTGIPLMTEGPKNDPVRNAYIYYGYNKALSAYDPLTILYAANGLTNLFKVDTDHGYNHIEANGTNRWVYDSKVTNQCFLRLNVNNETAAAEVDRLFLKGASDHARDHRQPKRPSNTRVELYPTLFVKVLVLASIVLLVYYIVRRRRRTATASPS